MYCGAKASLLKKGIAEKGIKKELRCEGVYLSSLIILKLTVIKITPFYLQQGLTG
jgi:hypothetical protein